MGIETQAKAQLYPTHGWITGTLNRSVHAEASDYNFSKDAVEANDKSPQRGLKDFKPRVTKSEIGAAVGSGQKYAMAVHQGFSGFVGYHYITNALARMLPKVATIFQGQARKHGLKR